MESIAELRALGSSAQLAHEPRGLAWQASRVQWRHPQAKAQDLLRKLTLQEATEIQSKCIRAMQEPSVFTAFGSFDYGQYKLDNPCCVHASA